MIWAFVILQANPMSWSESTRVGFVIFAIGIAISIFIWDTFNSNEGKK